MHDSVFRAYDLRGVVDVDFSIADVERLGRALGAYFRKHGQSRAAVGHDCRLSSPAFQDALAKGLAATGVDVVCLGMTATPVFYFAVKHLGLAAGAVVTASHNPAEFNGFKVWCGAATIHTDEIDALKALYNEGAFPEGAGFISDYDPTPDYVDAATARIAAPCPIRVVVDGGNGAGGEVLAACLKRIGAEVIELYTKPDGTFPNHHPDPVIEKNIVDMRAAVLENQAAVGLGLDGDADRLGALDETGRMLYGDQILAIFARDVLKDHPGRTVIGEVKCSHLLYKDIADHGGNPLMWITGHSMIKAKMAETDAVLAGEMSGHLFFADRWYGFDDAIYAGLRLVEILAKAPDLPLSARLADWPATVNTPEIRFDCPERLKFAVVSRALAYFKERYEVIDVDGARVVFSDGWGLVRASNTQPVLVLRFEAETEKRLAEIREIIEKPLETIIAEERAKVGL